MSTSVSPHGFAVVRGRERGYRPEQVDRAVGELSASRGGTCQRVTRLTAVVEKKEAEVARLWDQVAALPPQTFEALGARAQELLATSEAEAGALRDTAESAAHELREAAEAAARVLRDAARSYATEVRGEAEVWAEQRGAKAQRLADDVRVAARRDAEVLRAEGVAAVKDMRRRTADLLTEQEKKHAQRWDAAGRELAEREAALDSCITELMERAESGLALAQQRYADMEQSALYGQDAAEAQAAELLARARAWEERVAGETDRVLREHAGRREEVCRHLQHVRRSLVALSARVAEGSAAADAGTVPGPAPSAEG